MVPDRELGLSDDVTGEHVFGFQELFNRSDKAGIANRLKLLIAKAGGARIVMSAENLSNGTNFQYFRDVLAELDCQVLIYIRRQDELLTSSWQQWHSKGQTDLNAWLILALQRLGHWQRCIEGWESVAGTGNVTVRPFQKSDLAKGDVVDDFLAALGIEAGADDYARAAALVNPSYSDIITPIVSGNRFIFQHPHDHRFYSMVGALTAEAYVTQRRVSLITREQRESIVEYYRPQNETVCRRYFPGRQRLFDPVDHAKYEYLTAEELQQRQLGFLASLIYALYNAKR